MTTWNNEESGGSSVTGITVDDGTFTDATITNPTITGGTIDNTTIGATTPTTGAFTTLSATSDTYPAVTFASSAYMGVEFGTSTTGYSGIELDFSSGNGYHAYLLVEGGSTAGRFTFNTSKADGTLSGNQLRISHTDSANRYVTITGSAGGNPTIGTSAGSLAISSTQAIVASGTATPAGGTAGVGLCFGTTSNFGIFWGSGAPSLAAAQGSLYIRTDGGASTRLYSNNNGTTGWSAITSA